MGGHRRLESSGRRPHGLEAGASICRTHGRMLTLRSLAVVRDGGENAVDLQKTLRSSLCFVGAVSPKATMTDLSLSSEVDAAMVSTQRSGVAVGMYLASDGRRTRQRTACSPHGSRSAQISSQLQPFTYIVGLDTALCGYGLATETRLGRPHQLAGLARAGVAKSGTRVRAPSLGPPARLSTRMGRESADGFAVDLLTAPAGMGSGVLGHGRVASRTSPGPGLIRVLWLLGILRLVLVPFLDTVEVGDGPAYRAGPDLRGPHHLAGADDTLVLAVVDILLDATG